MKYLSEYRDADRARQYLDAIERRMTRSWSIMEVCGGQTHALVRFGLDRLLPQALTLLHGPGCPVCVTPVEIIDRALAIAALPNVVFCSYGDMLRVPGSQDDLLRAKAKGADVRIVYSALDALAIAESSPGREVVFFAVGFETTAPAHAAAVLEAVRRGVQNFSLLSAHVLVPPALEALLSDPECRVDAFLAAGHVCTIMGTADHARVAASHRVPIVVTGFEPLDLLQGIHMCIEQLESGRAELENQYVRSVRPEGNSHARNAISTVFEVTSRVWRGLGEIGASGLTLRPDFVRYDANARFPLETAPPREPPDCISGLVLRGQKRPLECSAFGKRCTPETPLGPTMVSSEGACAAYFRYRRVTE
jgi:hydrogenase expression/formation protein HypD